MSLDRAVERERHRNEKDAALAADHDRRRGGACWITIILFLLALGAGLPFWQALVLGAAAFVATHMAAGVSMRWW